MMERIHETIQTCLKAVCTKWTMGTILPMVADSLGF